MDLKGGIGYLNMRGNVIHENIDESNAVYIKGVYRDVNAIIKSKKLCVIYNAGTVLRNTPIIVTGYARFNNDIVLRILAVTSTSIFSSINKKIYIHPNDTYHVTQA